jgi:hypothetical protein
MLRLYGDGDPFYPFSHSRENFAAFQAAGGKVSSVSFHLPQPPTVTRSYGTPDLWRPIVHDYLRRQGLGRP